MHSSSGMVRAEVVYSVGQATKELHKLKDARNHHRERWLTHLKDSVQSWEKLLKLYTEQRANYTSLIKKAKQNLLAAGQTLEALNKQAAGAEEAVLDAADAEETHPSDADTAAALVQQVQQVLQACVKASIKEEPMEISDSEEPPPQASKRPRSLEPFGGTAPSSTM